VLAPLDVGDHFARMTEACAEDDPSAPCPQDP